MQKNESKSRRRVNLVWMEQRSQFVAPLNIPLTFQFAGKDTKNYESENGRL